MRVGVIGTRWGLVHVGAFRAAGAEVVALCGQDADATRELARAERIPLGTADVDALIAAVDVVVIASPDVHHRAHVERAAAAGRAVLCEKPLATTLADALAMQAAVADAPLAAVVFPYRYLPPFVALRDWLGGRRASVVVTVRSQFPVVAPRGGDRGGASHALDVVSWLLAAAPSAVDVALDAHTSAFRITYTNGSRAFVTWLHAPEPGIHAAFSIVGDEVEAGLGAGWIPAAGGWCISPARAFEAGAWRDLHPALAPVRGRPEPWVAACHALAADVVAALGGDHAARARLPTFADGVRVQALLEGRVVAAPAR